MAETPPPGLILAPDDIDRAFADGSLFARSAFRLELLDEYDSPITRERLARFLAGEPEDQNVRDYWDQVVGNARRAGKIMQRVHLVSEPLSDYLRFEFDFYHGSTEAGEDIRILTAEAAVGLDLPDFDYWLFDDARAAVMHYADRGAWLRTEIVTEPGFIEHCRRWRRAALSRAIPLKAYMAGRSAA
jgi:hypothetical protein